MLHWQLLFAQTMKKRGLDLLITNRQQIDNKQTTDIDAAILTDHMMLQATELGLGTVWVCFFRPDVIKQEFQLPDNLEPINILVIGYGKETPADPERHSVTRIPMEELVSYNYL